MADQPDPTKRPHAHPPVGSVAEEAARLLDALGGWVSTSGYAAGPAAGDGPGPAVPDRTDLAADDEAPHDDAAPDDAAPEREGAGPSGETGAHAPGHCEHCGAANGTGQAVTCQWCPVCQGIGLLRSVKPETVDRLADLAGALAAALRDVATHSRGGGGSQDGPPAGQDPRTRAARVQDITIEDEDQGSATR